MTFDELGVNDELFDVYNSYIDSINNNIYGSFLNIYRKLNQYFTYITGVSSPFF